MLRPLLAALALLTLPAMAQRPPEVQLPEWIAIEAPAPLVPEGATVEKVADGYKFTEGPAAGPDGCIYFTDIPAELILKYNPETGETVTYATDSGQANGLAFRKSGNLVACRHAARNVAFLEILPTRAANNSARWAPANYTISRGIGHRLNSPNDLAIDAAGGIYFTDPRYGNRDSMEMDVEGVYYASIQSDPDHPELPSRGWINQIIDAELVRPNGIVLSPDESILYVADNAENWIYAYDIVEPGKVENKRQFARLNDGKGGGSDGMCVDAKGRLYATGHNKVWVFEPNGELVTTIDVGPQTTNCTFAKDGRTLYITANKGLYRIELNTQEPLSAIDVNFDLMGLITVEGNQVKLEELADAIRSVPGFSIERKLFLRADASTAFKDLSQVLQECQRAGFETIEILALPSKE